MFFCVPLCHIHFYEVCAPFCWLRGCFFFSPPLSTSSSPDQCLGGNVCSKIPPSADGTGVKSHVKLMNICMVSVSMPSCVNPAVHDARETAGASTPGCFFTYYSSCLTASMWPTLILQFLFPRCCGYRLFLSFLLLSCSLCGDLWCASVAKSCNKCHMSKLSVAVCVKVINR